MDTDGQGYRYDAFISYRHREPDRTIAMRLQEMLETYAPPKEIARIGGAREKKIHLFRDEDELPMSANLSANIEEALRSSRFLICICSPAYRESRWCMQEIDQFKALHDGSTTDIITLVAEGEAPAVFPEQLTHETRTVIDETGAQRAHEIPVEPLAGNVAAPTMRESLKKLKREALRVAAPLLNVGFNDLYDRDARRRARRVWAVSAAVVAASLLFAAYSGAMVARIRQQNRALQEASIEMRKRDAWFSIEAADPAAAARSTLEALDSEEALRGGTAPETELMLARAASLYRSGTAPVTRIQKTFSANLSHCLYSPDGASLILRDYLNDLTVLDSTTGKTRFRRPELEVVHLRATEDTAYCAGLRTLVAFSLTDGRELWRYDCSGAGRYAAIAAMLLPDGADTMAIALHGGARHAGEAVFLDRLTGKARGACEIPWPVNRGDGAGKNGARYAMDGQGRLWFALPAGSVRGNDARETAPGDVNYRVGCAALDGTPRYADVTLACPVRAMLCDGEALYLNTVEDLSAPSSRGTLYCLDPASLEIRFQTSCRCDKMTQEGPAAHALLLMAGERILATAQNNVFLFDRGTGEELASWRLDTIILDAFKTGQGGVALYGPGGGYFLPDGAGRDFALGSERFVTFPKNAVAVAMRDAGHFAFIRQEDQSAVQLHVALPSQNLRPLYGAEHPYQRQAATGGIGNYGFRVTVGLSNSNSDSKGRMVFPVTEKEGTVSVYEADAGTGACRRLFDYALRPFEAIDFLRVPRDTASGDRVLAMGYASDGGLFLLFDERGAELDRLTLRSHPDTASAFLWDVDGSDYFATSRCVVWREGDRLRAHQPEGYRYTAFDRARDGAWAAAVTDARGGVSVVHGSAGDFENAVYCVEPETGASWRREGGAPISCLALSPEGRHIAFYLPDEDYICLYDVGARSMRDIPLGASEGAARMLFPDEEALLILTRDGRIFACGAGAEAEVRLVAELYTLTDGSDSYMERFRDGVVMAQLSGNGWAVDYRNGQVLAEIPYYLCGFGDPGEGKAGRIITFTELNGGIRNSDYMRYGYRLYLGDYLDAAALKERGRAFLKAFTTE